MTIDCYFNGEDPRVLGKTPTFSKRRTGQLMDSTDIEHPTLAFDNADIPLENYFWIEAFGKYYFRKSAPKQSFEGMWIVEMEEDYLETWKTEIQALIAIVARQEYLFNLNQKDPKMVTFQDSFVVTKKIGNNPFVCDPTDVYDPNIFVATFGNKN